LHIILHVLLVIHHQMIINQKPLSGKRP